MPFTACHTHHQPHPPPEKPDDDPGRQCTQHTTKMLASTIQISNNNPTPTHTHRIHGHADRPGSLTPRNASRHHAGPKPQPLSRLILQNPNSVPPPNPPATGSRHTGRPRVPADLPGGEMSMIPLVRHHHDRGHTNGDPQGCVLLRKEVIQPHLPVRLPCYDFVPIASPTFDHSPQQAGWAMGFGCCRLS